MVICLRQYIILTCIFNNTYYDSWLMDEFAQKMIKSVDKATVLSGQAVDSKALGVIPATKILK